MYYPKWKNYYFETHDKLLPDKWNLLRIVAKEKLSLEAQLKLEWIISYHTLFSKNARSTAIHFGISRKTLHKWLKRVAYYPGVEEGFIRVQEKRVLTFNLDRIPSHQ